MPFWASVSSLAAWQSRRECLLTSFSALTGMRAYDLKRLSTN